ncbi:L-arabinose transport system permease protein AraQ [Streptomyces sp. YIM 130001]|uniref:carbohydrate ABC transporter permease n=1 Tax=Streptomyces sp. YIM 130001 TaxID=2259644 RepID=UPI000E650A48|nr:carbohydrate ABC transporter permease [Streptomyces sp. YIM 130001]RII15626.1 L-arabinose transport system permease protein AraQ [Streptomyces sp. YIM 130001]
MSTIATKPAGPDTSYSARHRRAKRLKYVRVAAAALAGLAMALPLFWMLLTAFSPLSDLHTTSLHWWPSRFTLDNFRIVFDFPVWTWAMNSTVITCCVVAITVTINLLAGYVFAKMRFRGRNLVFLVLLSTMTVPVQVLMVPQFKLVSGMGLFGSFWAVILPASSTAFGIFLARQFMLGIPDEILEAARIDGAGQLRTFVTVVLPLCKPLIAVLSLLTFLYQWNDFAWPLTVLKDSRLYTLSVGMQFVNGEYTANYGAIMALALLSVLPMVVIFLCFQKYFVQGFARSGIK